MLGVNPIQHPLPDAHALATLPAASQQALTSREYFPSLLSAPFHQGLAVVFLAATALSLVAAFASVLRGGRYVAPEPAPGQAADRHDQEHATVRSDTTPGHVNGSRTGLDLDGRQVSARLQPSDDDLCDQLYRILPALLQPPGLRRRLTKDFSSSKSLTSMENAEQNRSRSIVGRSRFPPPSQAFATG